MLNDVESAVRGLNDEQLPLLNYLLDTYQYRFQVPWPAVPGSGRDGQVDFHKSEATVKLLFGGNRSGKTQAGALEVAWHVTGDYPAWYPEAMRFKLPVYVRIGITDYEKMGKQVVEKKLRLMLPDFDHRWYKKKHQSGLYVNYVDLVTGSIIDVISYQTVAQSWEGWQGHVAWFDEPPPYEAFVSTMRGLTDYNGIAMLTLTPLTEPWIMTELMSGRLSRQFEEMASSMGIPIHRAFLAVTQINIWDNPFVGAAEKLAFLATVPKDLLAAREEGEPVAALGRVYRGLTDAHACDPFKIPPGWTHYMAVDPHPVKATAVLWLAVSPPRYGGDSCVVVYREALFSSSPPSVQVGRMFDLEKRCVDLDGVEVTEEPCDMELRAIDRSCDRNMTIPFSMSTDGIVINAFRDYMEHAPFVKVTNSTASILPTQELLETKIRGTDGNDGPKLLIFKTCSELLRQLEIYQIPVIKSGRRAGETDDDPRRVQDDLVDCLHYLVGLNPEWVPPRRRPIM